MDLINKGVELIRRSTLKSHKRNSSQDSTLSNTPSISNSITSDDGSCYSANTPGQTPSRNSTSSNHHHPPPAFSITPIHSNPIPTPAKFDKSVLPDYLSVSPTRASPLSPLPRKEEEANTTESYFSLPTTTANPSSETAALPPPCPSTNSAAPIPPRSPMKSHFTPRPVHVNRVSTHAIPRSKLASNKQRRRAHRKLQLDDFVLKRTVGTGSFGRVHLAQSKVNGRHYAIKALDKYDVVRLKQVEHINNEPTILREVTHPFVVTLWDAFQDDTHLFMVMDYVPGGELFSILRKQKKFSEQDAKFYAAEVMLALGYLHEQDIVYRDLKPENILVDDRGHVKLTDFGFAKRIEDTTWTVCGTPDYLAPEIIISKGYTKAVDWWGLGVLIFEMVTGKAPFLDKNPVNLYQKILECRVAWPEDMSAPLIDLLQNLLTSDLELRFTSKEIKSHPWFADVDFEQVLKRKAKPPHVPKVKDDGDSTCFAKYKESNQVYGNVRKDPFRSKFPAF
ncbi:kinase-like domain-containing protein [Sporodiniella umbellata]|nr:kinase-like domain-containing protein [Sporodiniella umbellata]